MLLKFVYEFLPMVNRLALVLPLEHYSASPSNTTTVASNSINRLIDIEEWLIICDYHHVCNLRSLSQTTFTRHAFSIVSCSMPSLGEKLDLHLASVNLIFTWNLSCYLLITNSSQFFPVSSWCLFHASVSFPDLTWRSLDIGCSTVATTSWWFVKQRKVPLARQFVGWWCY